ncbi:hypothetical protein FQN57_006946 [Myotisia sp. PD_48]|nr:hypothetical protein FQN57_006946 [Myotisia sp. PD_48]
MSFLNSVLSSIETGEVSYTPPPALSNPRSGSAPAETKRAVLSKTSSISQRGNDVYTGTANKRKAGDDLRLGPTKSGRTTPLSGTPTLRLPRHNESDIIKPGPKRQISSSQPPKSSPAGPSSRTLATPAKPPPKGSFADIMAKAKALQGKAPVSVGLIKHQPVSKERKSRVQQKRLSQDPKHREKEAASGAGAGARGESDIKPRAPLPPPRNTKEAILRARQAEERKAGTYKGTSRSVSNNRLAAGKSIESEYAGTSALPYRKKNGKGDTNGRPNSRGRPPRDDYLGTDEEDEGDYYGQGEDYYSDESDMEAGLDEVEFEEQQALRIAKKEDEEELSREMALKKEKEARKTRLLNLAKARR